MTELPFSISYVEIAILTGVWISAAANVIFYVKKWPTKDGKE